jgi:hypothetical protein
MMIILFIVVCIGLYYLYNFLYSSNVAQISVVTLSGTIPCTKTISATIPAVASTNLTGVLDGGQYSASFWVYIADTKGFTAAGGAPLAHLMEISNKRFDATPANRGNTLVFVGLNPTNGTLVVRQSTNDATVQINNSMANNAATTTATLYPLDTLISSYTSGATYTTKDSCDIINGIEYQRWVLITTVANGKTLDVYVDGKLARSCVYKAPFALGSADSTGTASFGYGNGGKLKGFFSNGNFYNYALTPDAVWAMYQAGPGTGFSISSFFSSLFSINTSFGTTADATK